MEHNPGLTEEQDVSYYIKRDLLKHKETPYKIIRDEIVGRYVTKLNKLGMYRYNRYNCAILRM